jgi:hypothetical protein
VQHIGGKSEGTALIHGGFLSAEYFIREPMTGKFLLLTYYRGRQEGTQRKDRLVKKGGGILSEGTGKGPAGTAAPWALFCGNYSNFD